MWWNSVWHDLSARPLCNPPTQELPRKAWPAIENWSLSRYFIKNWWVSRSNQCGYFFYFKGSEFLWKKQEKQGNCLSWTHIFTLPRHWREHPDSRHRHINRHRMKLNSLIINDDNPQNPHPAVFIRANLNFSRVMFYIKSAMPHISRVTFYIKKSVPKQFPVSARPFMFILLLSLCSFCFSNNSLESFRMIHR